MAYRVVRGRIEFRSTMNPKRKIGRRGERDRRVFVQSVKDGIETSYHMTKGYRRKRVAAALTGSPTP